jgi:hypothetical protein
MKIQDTDNKTITSVLVLYYCEVMSVTMRESYITIKNKMSRKILQPKICGEACCSVVG